MWLDDIYSLSADQSPDDEDEDDCFLSVPVFWPPVSRISIEEMAESMEVEVREEVPTKGKSALPVPVWLSSAA